MLRSVKVLLCLAALCAAPTLALDEVVTKRVFRQANFTFASGETIPELRLGVETYGRINDTADNVVLICHFFAGDSHAAGKYPNGRVGWWDELIGPGKPIDTDRHFVVCTDLLSGMRVKVDTVVTTGPRSLDPTTGVPYGPRFPRVTWRDQVAAQRAVLDAFGVRHLKLVTGPSMGGMLALQWAVTHPGYMDAVLAVSAPIEFSAQERLGFQSSGAAIRSDPLWLFGDYLRYGVEPDYGMAWALYGLSDLSNGEAFYLPFRWASYLREAQRYDANHYLQTIDLHTAYALGSEYGSMQLGMRRITAPVILLGSEDDDFITPDDLEDAATSLRAAGVRAQRVLFAGQHGHLSCLEDLDELAAPVRAVLR